MSLAEMNASQILEMINSTGQEIVMRGTVNLTKVAQSCFESCKAWQFNNSYEFVWLFIIAFFFSQCTSFVLGYDGLTGNQQRKIVIGMKVTNYLLNLAGILWFLLILKGYV